MEEKAQIYFKICGILIFSSSLFARQFKYHWAIESSNFFFFFNPELLGNLCKSR